MLNNNKQCIVDAFYHTSHFFGGFIRLSAEQLKARENSSIFESDPITLEKVIRRKVMKR